METNNIVKLYEIIVSSDVNIILTGLMVTSIIYIAIAALTLGREFNKWDIRK